MNVHIGYGYSVWAAVSVTSSRAASAAPAPRHPAPEAPPPGTPPRPPAHTCHCIAAPGAAAPAGVVPAAGHVVSNPTNALAGAGGAPTITPDPADDLPPPPTAPAPADELPTGEVPPQRPTLSIDSLSPADFQKYRLKQVAASLDTSLKLELETREGDRITLDFRQLDVREQARLHGRGADGERVRLQQSSALTQRLVSIAVEGDLSEAERTAIDQVLDAVLASAREFFGGSFEQAAARLQDMAFDTATLLDFSLEMTQTRTLAATRGYGRGGQGLQGLAARDGEVAKVLDFFADTQRRLVEAAQEVLDERSAAKAVRCLLPKLLEAPPEAEQAVNAVTVEPLAELSGKAAGTA